MDIIFGSLTLYANRPTVDIVSPYLDGLDRRSGSHIGDKYKAIWTEATNLEVDDLYLPQRYKRMKVTTTSSKCKLFDELENLDSNFGNSRHLYKLNQMLTSFNEPMLATVNSVSTTGAASGAFYLLSVGLPMYLNLIFDLQDQSAQIAWSSFDLKTDMQSRNQFRYVFYPLPVMQDRPLFIHSQNICSRWWSYKRKFGEGPHSLLQSANTLELSLYKNPDLPTL